MYCFWFSRVYEQTQGFRLSSSYVVEPRAGPQTALTVNPSGLGSRRERDMHYLRVVFWLPQLAAAMEIKKKSAGPVDQRSGKADGGRVH